MAARNRIYWTTRTAIDAVLKTSAFDFFVENQCRYWNHRVLEDCSDAVDNLPALSAVQRDVVRDVYEDADCNLCPISS